MVRLVEATRKGAMATQVLVTVWARRTQRSKHTKHAPVQVEGQ